MLELVQISLVLLALLTVLLAGGVWIAIALMACGYVGMQYVGGNIPAGAVLATTIWGNSASWTLAALPFFFLLVAAVAIITVFPSIVMVLPRWVFPS